MFTIYKKFRKISVGNFRWEKCVPFRQVSFAHRLLSVLFLLLSRIVRERCYSSAVMNEIIKFIVGEENLINSKDYGVISILAAAATFIRRYLYHNSNTFLNVLCQHIRSINLIYLLCPKKAWLQEQILPTIYRDAVYFVGLMQILE